jgi:hypothetical protein
LRFKNTAGQVGILGQLYRCVDDSNMSVVQVTKSS